VVSRVDGAIGPNCLAPFNPIRFQDDLPDPVCLDASGLLQAAANQNKGFTCLCRYRPLALIHVSPNSPALQRE